MFEITDMQKIGVGLAGFGICFLFLGVLLIIDKGLLALGNILFIVGLGFVIGLERTFRFLFQRHKYKATTVFFGGIFIVLLGYPMIGMIAEVYGSVLLLSGFFPAAINFLRRVPVLGTILNMPGIVHQKLRSLFSFDGSDASEESDLFRTKNKKKKHEHSSTKDSFTLDEAGRNVSSFMSPTVIKDFASIQTPVTNEESLRRINTSIERSIEAESSEDGGNLTYVVTPALAKSKHSKNQISVVSTMRNSASAISSQGARSASVERTISAVSLGNLPESESRAKANPEKKRKAPPNQTAEVSELNLEKEMIAGKAETPREGAHFQISRSASIVRTMSPDSLDALSTTKIKAKEKANSAAQAPVSPNEKVKSPTKLDTKHLKRNTYIKSPKKKPETAFNEGYVSSDEDSETQRRPESIVNSVFSFIDAVVEAVASGISDDPLIESSKGTKITKKGKAQTTLAEGYTAHVIKSPKKSGKTTSESMIAMPFNVDEAIQDVASGCLDVALPLSSEGRKKENKQSVIAIYRSSK